MIHVTCFQTFPKIPKKVQKFQSRAKSLKVRALCEMNTGNIV